jgi:hypothetical protein
MNPVRVLGGLTRLTFSLNRTVSGSSGIMYSDFLWQKSINSDLSELSKRPSSIDRSTNVSSTFLID